MFEKDPRKDFIEKVVSGNEKETYVLRKMMGCLLDKKQLAMASFGSKGPEFVDLAAALLDQEGIRYDRTSDGTLNILHRAFSNTDLHEVVRDAISVTVLDGYRAAPTSFKVWTAIQNVTGTRNQYFTEWSVGEFKETVEAEEYAPSNLADRGAAGKIKRFKGVASITFEAFTNSGMSNLKSMGVRAGVAARQTALKSAYQTLLSNPKVNSGKTAFHADHGNLVEDVSATPAIEIYQKAAKALRNQADAAGNKLNLAPASILCPPSLEGAAKSLAKEINQEDNPWQKPVYVVSEPWLEDESLKNSSGTDWYLCADPKEAAMFGELTFDSLPIDERIRVTKNTGFLVDTISWTLSFETGFCPISTIGMVKVTEGE